MTLLLGKLILQGFQRNANSNPIKAMPKVILSVPIEISSEDEVSKQVLASLPNKRILVFGADLVDSLDELVGPAKFHMRALENPLSGHQVARTLHVVKSGTRFRVTEGNAEGINLAEEADLSYKSFSSFGEFVRRSLNGELSLGATPSTPEQKGQIIVDVSYSAGVTSTILSFNGQAAISNGMSDVLSVLQNFGSVTEDDQTETGTGTISYTIALNGNTPSIVVTDVMEESQYGTFNRTGYVAAVSGNLPNAIYLDQVAGILSYVRIASVPAGDQLAIVTRDAASETAMFE